MTHGGIWVLLQDPRTKQRLELNWYPPGSPFDTAYEPGDGLDHIGFKVSDPAAVTKKLLAKGAAPALAPTDKDGVKGIFYVKDPDGNWLEFFQTLVRCLWKIFNLRLVPLQRNTSCSLL